MFSQKKKRSKGLLFLIPVIIVFLAGLRLNAFMSGGEAADDGNGTLAGVEYDNDKNEENEKEVNNIPVYEYTDNAAGNAQAEDPATYGEHNDVAVTDTEVSAGSAGTDAAYTGYRVTSVNGRLVIYKYTDGILESEDTTDIPADMLPEYDREMLAEGINAGSEAELEEIMQDYEG